MSTIVENLQRIQTRIRSACDRVGRDPEEVQLVGITKTVSIDRVREGVQAGLRILGENYVQEALKKQQELHQLPISWHFVGHLQTNKARAALESFDCIHTLDRMSLARELDRQAHKLGRQAVVLIQVNTGQEETKSGIDPEGFLAFFKQAAEFDGLVVRGLMCLPPYFDDPEEVRPHFRRLRELLSRAQDLGVTSRPPTELSMGMSHDFEMAIEEGATLVRVGTALFGARRVS